MLLAIFFVNVWGVLQLVALGSFARTVRVRTVLGGIAVGLFFCAPFAGLLEYTWTAAIAALTHRPVEAVIAVTGYTVDPPIEEIIRILPLLFLLIVPVIRRQLSVTDCVLIGAAAGAGVSLAEDFYRFGTAPQHATSVPGGWVAPFHSPIVESASGRVFIPSIGTALGGWLPDMGGVGLFGLTPYMLPNLMLIWSSLVGLGVGLWLRLEGRSRWFIAAALLAYASSAHAANNADITVGRLLVTAPFRALSHLQPLMPIAALAIAWWIDRRRQRNLLPEHLLAAEQAASPRALGTLRASTARLPESIFWIDRFVRVRRAYNTERFPSGPEADDLRVAITDVCHEIDNQLRRPGSWYASGVAWRDNARRVLRQPATIVWLVLTLPSTLWFVVGGWPATAGVQRLLSAGTGWGLVVGLTVAAQAAMAWRMLSSLLSWRRLLRIPTGDPGAAVVLSFVGGAGALGFGMFGLLRMSAPATAGVVHLLDALASLASQYLSLANLGAALAEWLRRLGDVHVPIPFTKEAYFTPEGPVKGGLNSAGRELVHNSGPLGRGLETFGGPDAVPQFNLDSDDPNNWNPYVGPLSGALAVTIFGGVMTGPEIGAEMARGMRGAPTPPAPSPMARPGGSLPPGGGTPPPRAGTGGAPVDPFAVTQPSPGVGAPVPMSVLQRESPAIDPLARTYPAPRGGVDQFGRTQGAPPPNVSPKATTISPSAKTIPPGESGVPFGSADTQPAPVLKPSDTARIDDP